MRAGLNVSCVGLLLLAASGGASGQTSPPAAPQVTTGADLKQLIFDWDPVPGATYYQLLEKTWTSSSFEVVRDDIAAPKTRVRLNIASHLIHWQYVRYIVAACNAAGCTNSDEIAVQDQMLDTLGYFKASNTEAGDAFGDDVAVSADGQTLAVASQREASSATGVNGDQTANDSPGSGAVYVYHRSGGEWRQEAYLKAGENQAEQFFGTSGPVGMRALSINRDGTLIAVGASHEDVTGFADAGAVYIYERSTTGSWSLATTLHAPHAKTDDFFGASVDLSLNGRTLKVSSMGPRDAAGNAAGRSHIYVRGANGWRHSKTLAPFYAGDFCETTRMSADGQTLVQYCHAFSGGVRPRVVTLKRSGNDWVHASDLDAPGFMLPQPLAVNADATQMAVRRAVSGGVDVQIYRWLEGTGWTPEINFIPPSNSPSGDTFGESLAFNGDGTLLAIGEPGGPYTGAGVLYPAFFDGTGEQRQGVVHLLLREESNPEHWAEIMWIKAPNPENGDAFGDSVALSGTGRVLAVGAPREDGGATGVDGDRSDESALDAGAVYLY
jgi:FG-GAP repeat